MLEGRTKDGPVLIVGWFHLNKMVTMLCIKPDGLFEAIPGEQVSADWHYDVEKGWTRDFQEDDGDEG